MRLVVLHTVFIPLEVRASSTLLLVRLMPQCWFSLAVVVEAKRSVVVEAQAA
jgi:hypothetical protein